MTNLDRTREWARLGAQTRLAAIEQERAAILEEFPELKHAGTRYAGAGPVRRRRKLTATERRKLSQGMRRYWRKRKAQAAGKA